MTKEEYRAAFSKLQPSREAVDRLLAIPEEQPKRRRPIRLGALIAVAVIVVLLLGGTVYAAHHWFRLTDGSQIKDPNEYESGEPTRPAPQNGISLEDQGEGNYIGFTLDGWTLPDRKQGANDIMLQGLVEFRNPNAHPALNPETLAKAYTRYYPILPDGELLCVQVLDRDGLGYRDYFSRYEMELMKEGILNGMETVWLTIKGAPDDSGSPEDSYHLFCHNEALRCTLVASSNRDFERCEEALSHLTLVDSGVPILRADTKTIYGLRLSALPVGFEIDWDYTTRMEEALNFWEAMDSEQDLNGVYGHLVLKRVDNPEIKLVLGIEDHWDDYAHFGSYHLDHCGMLSGHEVLWYHGPHSTLLKYRFSDGTQAHLNITELGPEAEDLLASLAPALEPVGVEVVREAPLEFLGFSQG